MSELTPITRVESYLDAIVNNGIPPTEDITRIETFLQAIYDNQVCALTPITRIEMFLGKISGQDIELPQPITRAEMYLAAIAGEDVELPENPITRLEMYLAEWADSGDWTTISGAIVEFITQRAHKLKSCVVSLSPQQDLHGQDAPYPAGGGKNLCDGVAYGGFISNNIARISSTTPITSPVTAPVAYYGVCFFAKVQNGSTYAFSSDATGVDSRFYWAVYPTVEDATNASNVLQHGNTNSFTANNDGYVVFMRYNFKDAVITWTYAQAEIGSTATAYVPYENICPISGRTGVTVEHTGKNLANVIYGSKVPSIYTGEMVSYSGWSCDFVKVDNTEQYYVSTEATTSNIYTLYYDEYKNYLGYTLGFVDVTAFQDWNKTGFIKLRSDSGQSADPLIQLELGNAASEYEEFNGNSYSVTWEDEAGTVYGGSLDIVSGKLTITLVDLNMADIKTWNVQPSTEQRIYVIRDDLKGWPSSTTPAENLFCNRFKPSSFYDVYNNHYNGVAISTGKALQFHIDGLTDNPSTTLADVNNYFSENETHVVAELENPIEIQLTPQQVSTLKGYNAMWSNGGDIEVTVHGTPVEVSTQQALNMLLGGAYRNDQTAEDVSDEEALDIILGGEQR